MTTLLIGAAEKATLTALRERAAAHPIAMLRLIEELKSTAGKRAHMARMTAQTVEIPQDFLVTFSIETGHRAGTCRHMSVSAGGGGRVPQPAAVWMIAEALGFVAGLDACAVWPEELRGHGMAVNVVQPLSVIDPRMVAPSIKSPETA